MCMGVHGMSGYVCVCRNVNGYVRVWVYMGMHVCRVVLGYIWGCRGIYGVGRYCMNRYGVCRGRLVLVWCMHASV